MLLVSDEKRRLDWTSEYCDQAKAAVDRALEYLPATGDAELACMRQDLKRIARQLSTLASNAAEKAGD